MYDSRIIRYVKRADKRDEVSRFLVFAFMGFAVLFGVVILFRSNGTPLDSFVIACTAGFVAIAVSGLWLLRYPLGNVVYALMMCGYLARILFGIYVYTELDPGYFQGNGAYLWGHPEIELSFDAARIVFDSMTSNESFSLAVALAVLNEGDSKNPLIHWWMGLFLVSTGFDNAMDLAAFNAVHMSISALGLIALALNLGYSRRAAYLAGIVTAWYPFAFISSLLWRDAIGFTFVVLAVGLASQFKLRSVSTWYRLAGSLLLAFAHRTVYPVVILLSFFLSVSSSAQGASKVTRGTKRKLIMFLGIFGTLVVTRVFSDYLFLYYSDEYVGTVLGRLMYFPILFARAVLGPFPWFNELPAMMFWDRIFEFAFHVLQLAVFLGIARHYRRFLQAPDMNVYAFLLFFGTAMLAPGTHTAYLSVGLPFAFARLFSFVRNFSLYLIASLFLFVIFNVLFFVFGFSGQGFSSSITGY